MAHSRRVPDPRTDLEIDKALQRLRDDLAREDPLVTEITNPFAAAAAHLARCNPGSEPEPKASAYPRFIAIPKGGKSCCGKALAIKYLWREAHAYPTVQPLFEAIVAIERLLAEAAQLLEKPLPTMLRTLSMERQSRARAGIRIRKPSTRTLTISRPAADPPELWLVDGLRKFYRSAPRSARPNVVQEKLILLLNALVLALDVRHTLEQQLQDVFRLDEVHKPVPGPGRPELLLLKEITRLLVATGHSDEEINRLLPDGRGDLGAVDRVRARVPAGMRKKDKKKRAKGAPAKSKPPKKGRGNPTD